MQQTVVVIGGGIAGMEASAQLSALGHRVILLENENSLGGHLKNYSVLFPNLRKGCEIVDFLKKGMEIEDVEYITKANIKSIENYNSGYKVQVNELQPIYADAILIATGYKHFEAKKKEEYGYGIYKNVITSFELEKMFVNSEKLLTPSGSEIKKVALIHCVGSRDEKVNNRYCSNVCCVTGVKQAMEIRSKLPDSQVYNFYMDMRMFDTHFEELYHEAQFRFGVKFIRGRLSEASETIDKRIVLKAEDTLNSRPIKLTVDMVVLLTGMEVSDGTKDIARMLNLEVRESGFLKPKDDHMLTNIASMQGIFMAGACSGPMSIKYAFTDARAAVTKINSYLKQYQLQDRLSDFKISTDTICHLY